MGTILNSLTAVLCLAIVLCFWWFRHLFLAISNRISADLDSSIREIKKFQNAFYFFDEASDALGKNRTVGSAWNAYQRQLVKGGTYGLEDITYSLKHSREFFHEESLWLNQFSQEKYDERLFASMPSMLTGLGILGTFMGLTIGLSISSIGLGDFVSETAEIDASAFSEAFVPLLAGAGQAFATSIVGLICSFLYTFTFRRSTQEILAKIEILNETLESSIHVLTSEEISLQTHKCMFDMMVRAKQISNDWQASLKAEFKTIVDSIAGLRESFTGFSGDQLGEIHKVMGSIAENFSGQIAEEMAKISQTFKDASVGVDHAVKALDLTLNKMTGIVDEVSSKVNVRFTEYDEHSSRISENLKQTASRMDAAYAETQDAFARLVSNGQEFSNAVKESGGLFLKDVSEGTAKLNETFDRQASVLQRMADLNSSFSSIEASISDLFRNLDETAEVIRSSLDISRQVQGHIDGIMNSVSAAVTEANRQNAEAIKRSLLEVSQQLQSITATQDKITALSEKLKDTLLDVTGNLATGLKNANESFAKNVSNLDVGISQVVRTMSSGMTAWRKEQEEHSKKLLELGEKLTGKGKGESARASGQMR